MPGGDQAGGRNRDLKNLRLTLPETADQASRGDQLAAVEANCILNNADVVGFLLTAGLVTAEARCRRPRERLPMPSAGGCVLCEDADRSGSGTEDQPPITDSAARIFFSDLNGHGPEFRLLIPVFGTAILQP